MAPRRLINQEMRSGAGGARVFVARSFGVRLLGLALLSDFPREWALLLPGCSSVHTFGMRFALEIRFLDEHSEVMREESAVGPGRVLREPCAAAVLEWRSPAQEGPNSAANR